MCFGVTSRHEAVIDMVSANQIGFRIAGVAWTGEVIEAGAFETADKGRATIGT